MTSRILQLILGIVITVCSMPQGMAKDHTPQQPRASFFTEQVSAGGALAALQNPKKVLREICRQTKASKSLKRDLSPDKSLKKLEERFVARQKPQKA